LSQTDVKHAIVEFGSK